MHEVAIIEYDLATAEREIAAAWQRCQKGEKDNLEFGRICCEWRDKLKSKGGRGNTGSKLLPLWQKLNIPQRTAYNRMEEYEISIGTKEDKSHPVGPNGRTLDREKAAEELTSENLFPTYTTVITPAVVGAAPDGIGYNVEFKDLTLEKVHQLANMPIEVPNGVKALVEINRQHFDAVFAKLVASALEDRVVALANTVRETYSEED